VNDSLPPNVTEVTDPSDAVLADFSGLTDVAARSAIEPAAGMFIAEGAKVISRALAAGLRPRRLLCTPRFYTEQLAAALQVAGHQDVPIALVSPELAREVTGFRVHRGALAAFDRPTPADPGEFLQGLVRGGARTLLVLVDLVDHTNVGAIFRNAAALGVDGVLVTARCADPWYRRSIKVSMGAVFAVPWASLGTEDPDPLPTLRAHGITSLALSPDADGGDIRSVNAPAPRAILVGTEGAGLPAGIRQGADLRVRIPMARGIDSLNVAAATAIACHHFGNPAGFDAIDPAAAGD
jgi:tRNA G18 (ribose-2'-O)-methylase SpoU